MLPSIETLPGYDACAAFTVNSASVFKEDVDIMPTIVDDTLSYVPWGGDWVIGIRPLWPNSQRNRHWLERAPPCFAVTQIVGYLRSGSFNSRRLADIVNYIQLNPESFEEWHQSVIAQRFANGEETAFAPPVFRNEKKASGYFF